jgi:hypothetical protein
MLTRLTMLALAMFAAALLSGCELIQPAPQAHQSEPAPPAEPEEPPQVVEEDEAADPSPGSVGELSSRIQAFIERHDDLAARAGRPSGWQPDPNAPAQQVASAEPLPLTTQPAVVVIPEPPSDESSGATAPPPAAPATQPSGPIEPPRLGNVSVRAVPNGELSLASPPATAANAPRDVAAGPTSLADVLAGLPEPTEGSFREQLDDRTRWATTGDYQRARAPLSLVTAEQQELAAAFIEALIALRESHMGDLSAAANEAVAQFAQLEGALRRLSDLRITRLELCRAVHGFGQFEPIDPPDFVTGHPVEFVLYCQLADFVSEHRDEHYHSAFDMTTTILTAAGDRIDTFDDPGIVDRCRDQRHDCFISRLVRLPATLSPGSYVAKVTVVDKLGRKVAERRVTFRVVTRP